MKQTQTKCKFHSNEIWSIVVVVVIFLLLVWLCLPCYFLAFFSTALTNSDPGGGHSLIGDGGSDVPFFLNLGEQ